MTKTPWWRLPRYDAGLGRAVTSRFSASGGYHARRLRLAAAAAWAYERDRYDFDSYPSFLDEVEWGESWYRRAPRSNVIFTATNSATAWLFSDQPALEVRAEAAPFELRDAIRDRSLALTATIDSVEGRQVMMDVGRDGWLTGWGGVCPRVAEDRVTYHRLQADRVWWDPLDAADGRPWSIALWERWDRDALTAWYRDLDQMWLNSGTSGRARLSAAKIRDKLRGLAELKAVTAHGMYGDFSYLTPYEWALRQDGCGEESDAIGVCHLWRRATGGTDGDGRYVLIAGGPRMAEPIVLIDVPYAHRDLPLCWWSPYPAPSGGLVGTGLAQVLDGHQRALDRSDYRVQSILDELGWSKIIVGPETSEADVAALGDKGISVIRGGVAGQQPQVIEPPALRGDHIQYGDIVRRRVRDDSGLGGVIAAGQTSLGAGASGIAQVEEARRQTDRVSDVYERWLAMRVSCGARTLEAIEDGLARDLDFRASFRDADGSWRETSWRSLHRMQEPYHVTLEPAGFLGRTRAGRITRALELGSQGFLSPALVQDMLLESPDLRAAQALESAPRRMIDRMISVLIDPDGDHTQAWVSRDLDLPLASDLSSRAIAQAYLGGAQEETIDRLRAWKAEVDALLAQIQAEQAPPPDLGGGGTPPAMV